MENGAIRITVFLLLAVAALTGLSALVGSGDPRTAAASERRAEAEQALEPEATDTPTDMPRDRSTEPSRQRPMQTANAGRSFAPDALPSLKSVTEPGQQSSAFLNRSHDLKLPPASPETRTWTWDDDSTQIVFDGCKAKLRDPLVPKAKFKVTASVDFAALEAVEEHFGFYPPEVFALQNDMAEDDSHTFADRLGADSVAALGRHGILIESNIVRADFAWLVRQTSAQLRPLAQAVVEEWRHAVPEPADDGTPRAGNIPRSTPEIEALTSFVQRGVRYAEVPANSDEHERCGVRTPGPTLTRGGDCDSKALLLAALIRSIDSRVPILLISLSVSGRPHMMIGVGTEARDCNSILDYGGRRYVLIEVTSALGVGIMAPDYNDAVLEHYTVIP
jgi:hypothetical protein